MRRPTFCPFLLGLLLLAGCREAGREAPLFVLVPPGESGVTFANRLTEREGFNGLEYEYFYNGGGVAVGDVDGDGLPDLFFTANMGPNALYRNLGGFRFEDVTARAGVAGGAGWKTGATMADVNGDGWLDIYVCRSGNVREALRRNELYVNNGDGTFTEAAAAYGLDDPGYATHATFFDYDRDGDLDAFVVNHNVRRLRNFVVELVRKMHDPFAGDRLYRNDPDPAGNARFVDVSAEAGILGNPIGFGLSATAGDVDLDGWPDLYVANDFVEDDYLYLNNGDGTFREALREVLAHTSYSSMGADLADFNNDARPDLLTLDMLPEDDRRRKLLYGPVDVDEYRSMFANGFHHQLTRNMLHLNQGAGRFSEIGQMAGVAATDWSWAPLLADFDNDGFKDLFVTTGYLRDYTDMDFWEHDLPAYVAAAQAEGRRPTSMELLALMPSTKLRSYLFRNRGDLTFEPVSQRWGITRPSHSNGAAYADLDADGDLDLVTNNVDEPAFLYRNDADRLTTNRWLKVRLEGDGANRFGVGAKVTVTTPDSRMLYQELMPARGYQSSVEPVLHFGLGEAATVSVAVAWPDGRHEARTGVAAGQTLVVRQTDAGPPPPAPLPPPGRFVPLPDALGLDHAHHEDAFDDFAQQPLLPHRLSRAGPALAHADVNRDGLEDVYLGGARGQPGALFLQQSDGHFARVPTPAFDAHAAFEDVAALFFDADGDHAPDLYVVSGGADTADPALLQDRLYRNNGFGAFAHDPAALPSMPASGGAVAAGDVDGDGDADLFAGGRVLPGRYPYPPRSYLLLNDGGRFADATDRLAPALREPGMVTAAAFADLDGDARPELVLAGEWMPLRVFARSADGSFADATARAGLDRTSGWWNALVAADLDGDGDVDLAAGNRGLNALLQATPDEPASLLAADFDGGGTVDLVLTACAEGRRYPVAMRDELVAQMPALGPRFARHAAYADATLADVLSDAEQRQALRLDAHTFATTVFENRGDGTFVARPLPPAAQFAPVYAIVAADLDRDGTTDLLLAGNDSGTPPRAGRDDAGRGLFLRGRPGLAFEPVPPAASGFVAPSDVRGLALLNTRAGYVVVVSNNDAATQVFGVR